MSKPGYWMNETSGVLRPAVEAYLHNEPLSPEHIAGLRAYLRQWIEAEGWAGDLSLLRATVGSLSNRREIDRWLAVAWKLGIDPL